MQRGTPSDHDLTERGLGTNKPNIRRSLRKFVTHIHSTVSKQELLWALTTLLYDFNRTRSYIREKQLNIWVDYIMACQSTQRSKVELVENCKAIESQYLSLQRKQLTLGMIFMSAFHVTLDAVSESRSHFEAMEKVKSGMKPVLDMCTNM